MSHPSRVVALVPVRNAAESIRPTLDALSAQTYRNLEILVSVDLSSDASAEICFHDQGARRRTWRSRAAGSDAQAHGSIGDPRSSLHRRDRLGA